MASPIVKWMTAVFGRLHHGDWLDEDEKLIFGADWMYALKLLPHQMSQAEVDEVVAGVTESMIEKSWLIGTPVEIARQLDPWIDGGANYIAPSDLAPAALELHEQARAMERMIELAAHMKGVNAISA